ncbi:MAG: hypothetical protein ACTHOI_03290 [Sphingomicrobium sp.]
MHARFAIIAAAGLALATSAAGQSTKTPAPQPNSAQAHPAPVVLASADHVARAPTSEAAPAAKPHRAARVTTCRCGDPQAAPQDDRQ